MDKTTLVDQDLHDVLELIKALEIEQLEIHSALWLYDPEVEEWKLIIASPFYDEEGPRKTFSFILNVFDQMDPPLNLALSDISVISPLDELI